MDNNRIMEYLMTYGWAILVVIVIGVVLWQLGLFGDTYSTENNLTDEECLDFCEQITQNTVGARAHNKNSPFDEYHYCICDIERCIIRSNITLCLMDELKFTINNTIENG